MKKLTRQKLYATVLVLALLVSSLPRSVPLSSAATGTDTAAATTTYDVWDGTSDISWYTGDKSTYDISIPQQLAGLAQLVNDGNDFAGKTIVLKNDMYLNDTPESKENAWVSIAMCQNRNAPERSFQGNFQGNGYSIYNMYVPSGGSGGLFGSIGDSGVVSAVNICQGSLNCGGCIADCNKGIIQFCCNDSDVGSGDDYEIGGICNTNYNLVYGCQNRGDVRGEYAGGIVGENRVAPATINECSNHGTVRGDETVAGIAADNYGWIYNCYNVGTIQDGVKGTGTARQIGGIVGDNRNGLAMGGGVEKCYVSCTFLQNAVMMLDAICTGSDKSYVKNCYYTDAGVSSNCGEKVEIADLLSQSMVERLSQGSNNTSPAWTMDVQGLNRGMPVNIADHNRENGVYKRVPELWVLRENREATVDVGNSPYTFSIKMYYGDAVPRVRTDAPNVAVASYEGDAAKGIVTVELKNPGTTSLYIEIPESQTTSSVVHQIQLTVTDTLPKPTSAPTSLPYPTRSPDVSQRIPSGVTATKTASPVSASKTRTKDKQQKTEESSSWQMFFIGNPMAVSRVTISSVQCKKGRKIHLTWKKVSGAKGYQISYSTSKKFQKKKQLFAKKTSATLKKLKSGRTYYIKLRAYRLQNGRKFYGKWSKVKKVKMK